MGAPRLEIRPCTIADLDALATGAAKTRLLATAEALLAHPAWTGCVDGRPVIACGTLRHARHWLEGWALVGDVPRRAWPAITRAVRAAAQAHRAGGVRLLEITVGVADPRAERWARRLGFGITGVRRGYLPDGGDVWLMAWGENLEDGGG